MPGGDDAGSLDDLAKTRAGDTSAVGSPMVRAEQVARLRRALALLADEDRELIECRYLRTPEMEFEALAERFGQSAASLRERAQRIRGVLAEGLELLGRIERAELPPHYERILVERHFARRTMADLAAEMGIDVSAVGQLARRADELLLVLAPPEAASVC